MEDILVSHLRTYFSGTQGSQDADTALTAAACGPGFIPAALTVLDAPDVPASWGTLLLILLKRYTVSECWEAGAEYQVPAGERALLRAALLKLLHHPVSKVRTQAAVLIASVAEHDWPAQWPELFPALEVALADTASAEGQRRDAALLCLKYFTETLSPEQAAIAAKAVLPHVLQSMNLPGAPVAHKVRGFEVLSSFITLLTAAEATGSGDASAATLKEVVHHTLVTLAQALALALPGPAADDEAAGVLAAQNVALGVLKLLLETVPKLLRPVLGELLPRLGQWAAQLTAQFVAQVVDGDGGPIWHGDDGMSIDYVCLAQTWLSVLAAWAACANGKVVKSLKPFIPSLVQLCLYLCQLPASSLEAWAEDPDQFVAEEQNIGVDASVRCSVQDALGDLWHAHAPAVLASLVDVAAVPLARAVRGDNSGPLRAWKCAESALLLMGVLGPQFAHKWKSAAGSAPLDVPGFLRATQEIIGTAGKCLQCSATSATIDGSISCAAAPTEHTELSSAFLVARALATTARMGSVLAIDQIMPLIHGCVHGLGTSQTVPVRMAACTALRQLLRTAAEQDPTGSSWAAQVGPAVERLGELCVVASEDTLHVPLQAVCTLVSRSAPDAVAASERALGPLLVALWIRHINHPTLSGLTSDAIAALLSVQHAGLRAAFIPRMFPTLGSVLQQAADAPGAADMALQLLRKAVDVCGSPIPEPIKGVLPDVVALLQSASKEDTALLQYGADVLAAYVEAAGADIHSLVVPGTSQLFLGVVMAFLSLLLEPDALTDSACLGVGRLLTAVLLIAGDVRSPDVQVALARAVQRLAHAKLPSLHNRIVLVFAALFSSADSSVCSALVSTLAHVQVPVAKYQLGGARRDGEAANTGGTENGAAALCRAWLATHRYNDPGTFAWRVAAMGLQNLLTCAELPAALAGAVVPGALQLPQHTGVQTRTAAAAAGAVTPDVSLLAAMWAMGARVLLDIDEHAKADAEHDDEDWADSSDAGSDDGEFEASQLDPNAFISADELAMLSDVAGGGTMVDLGMQMGMWGGDDDDDSLEEEDPVDEFGTWSRTHPAASADVDQHVRAALARGIVGAGAVHSELKLALRAGEFSALEKALQGSG